MIANNTVNKGGHDDDKEIPAFIIELNSTSCPRVQSFLKEHSGHLVDVGPYLLQGLRGKAPQQLAARVGDYNENLFYEMQDTDKDISGIVMDSGGEQHYNEKPSDEQLLQDEIEKFEASICSSLQQSNLTYRGSFMRTESTMYQPAHVDYEWQILTQYGEQLFLAFFPLTEEGAYLQLWQDESSKEEDEEKPIVEGTVVFIPYGKMLIVPSDTIHGGGFKRGSSGNLRFHLYIALEEEEIRKENDITLLDHPMNKYTEKHDRRRELCERFVDAKGLEDLLGVYFDVQQPDTSSITSSSTAKDVDDAIGHNCFKIYNNDSCSKSAKLDFEIAEGPSRSASYVNLFGLTEEVM
jgi:hypothetical protein